MFLLHVGMSCVVCLSHSLAWDLLGEVRLAKMIYVFHEVAVMCDDINDVLSRQAIAAHGVDRHLLGLRMLANESGMEMPQIFTDVAYTRSTHWLLSTSQV